VSGHLGWLRSGRSVGLHVCGVYRPPNKAIDQTVRGVGQKTVEFLPLREELAAPYLSANSCHSGCGDSSTAINFRPWIVDFRRLLWHRIRRWSSMIKTRVASPWKSIDNNECTQPSHTSWRHSGVFCCEPAQPVVLFGLSCPMTACVSFYTS
jgi:hypothetical protein